MVLITSFLIKYYHSLLHPTLLWLNPHSTLWSSFRFNINIWNHSTLTSRCQFLLTLLCSIWWFLYCWSGVNCIRSSFLFSFFWSEMRRKLTSFFTLWDWFCYFVFFYDISVHIWFWIGCWVLRLFLHFLNLLLEILHRKLWDVKISHLITSFFVNFFFLIFEFDFFFLNFNFNFF